MNGSDDGSDADGIEAGLHFNVPPNKVVSYASLQGSQALQEAIASSMLVDSNRVSVMSLSAASTVPGSSTVLPSRRLVDGTVGVAPPGGAITGDVQADFVVLCNSATDRQSATKKILAMSSDPIVRQRFVAALAHISSVDPDHVRGVMLDRQWSRSAASRSKISGDDGLTVASSKIRHHQSRSLFGLDLDFLIWPLAALAAALMLALLACAVCNARRGGYNNANFRGKEAQALLSGNSHDWSDDEPEKGEVPNGVLGFNPKSFSPEKYKSTGMSEADLSNRSFNTQRSQKQAGLPGAGLRGPGGSYVPAPPNLGGSFVPGSQPRTSFAAGGQPQSFSTIVGSQPQSFAIGNHPQSFNLPGSQQSFRPGYGN